MLDETYTLPTRPEIDPDERAVPRPNHRIDLTSIPRTSRLVTAWIEGITKRSLGEGSYLATTTVAVHQRNMRVWLRYLAEEVCCDEPTPDTVAAFRIWASRFRKRNSVNAILEAVRQCYRWGAEQQLSADIAHDVENLLPDGEAAPLPRLHEDDFQKALQAIAGDSVAAHRDRSLLCLLREVPVDTIALARANVGALDLEQGILHLVPSWGLSRWKRGLEAQATKPFPVPPAVLVHLVAYLRARGRPAFADPLFAAVRGGRRMTTLGMRLVVLRTLVAAGLRQPTPGLARHDLQLQYPHLTPADLPGLSASIPDHPDRKRILAILALLAHPDTRGPLETFQMGDIEADGAAMQRKFRCRGGGRMRRVEIPETCRPFLADWLQEMRANTATGPLFPGPNAQQISKQTLRRLAWMPFPDRARDSLGSAPTASSRILRKAPIGMARPSPLQCREFSPISLKSL